MKILIVDDEEMIRGVLREYVEFEGNEAFEAENGMQAVKLCRENDYDLVLMDIMMPRLNGLEATKVIRNMQGREDGADIPIVAMTANAYASDIERSLEAGMNAHLIKPIETNRLYSILQQCKLMRGEVPEDLLAELKLLGVDVETALRTLSGKEDLYRKLLYKFVDMEERSEQPKDFTEEQVPALIETVHALKGVTGNLAITPLFDAYTRILGLLREGQWTMAKQVMTESEPLKDDIINCINKYR